MRATPPNEIALVYREVGASHVFNAPEVPGFHIGSSLLKKAFEQALIGLGEHMSRVCGRSVHYGADLTYEQFLAHLKNPDLQGTEALFSNFVIAKIAEERRAPA
jgi:hypothetical protein